MVQMFRNVHLVYLVLTTKVFCKDPIGFLHASYQSLSFTGMTNLSQSTTSMRALTGMEHEDMQRITQYKICFPEPNASACKSDIAARQEIHQS